jgi:hypothetical protein
VVFEASYLVLGLGDVYLGAPCAVPVNPMHRVVTTKMNPARTFTHEGTVGERTQHHQTSTPLIKGFYWADAAARSSSFSSAAVPALHQGSCQSAMQL